MPRAEGKAVPACGAGLREGFSVREGRYSRGDAESPREEINNHWLVVTKMYNKLAAILILWTLPLAGCSAEQPNEVSPVLTETDVQVLQAVVHDWDQADESICVHGMTGGVILVQSSTARESNATQIRADIGAHHVPDSLIQAFVERNIASACLPSDLAADGRTTITKFEDMTIFYQTDRFAELYPKAKSYMQFSMPVYMDPGNTALVRFDFGPTPHGATCTYFLRRQNNRWIVVWRKPAYYA